MPRSRMRRCSSDFDDLIKQKRREWELEAEERGIRLNLSDTKVTSIFAHELRKKKIPIKDIKDLILLIQLSDINYENKDDLPNIVSSDRILPGEGSFNWKKFIYLLQKLRYRGKYSLKLPKSECSKNLYEKIYSFIDGIIRDYWRMS